MPFGDDDSACVSPDFDDVAEVVVGVVVRLSVVFLDAFEDGLAMFGAPLCWRSLSIHFIPYLTLIMA